MLNFEKMNRLRRVCGFSKNDTNSKNGTTRAACAGVTACTGGDDFQEMVRIRKTEPAAQAAQAAQGVSDQALQPAQAVTELALRAAQLAQAAQAKTLSLYNRALIRETIFIPDDILFDAAY